MVVKVVVVVDVFIINIIIRGSYSSTLLTESSLLTIGAKFAFSIYDFEGNGTMDAFFIGDCLRALNLNPTLAVIEKVGGKGKKKEKMIKVDDFLPIFAQVKKDKDAGSFEDFMEVLKLYDKTENGTMMYAELEHILLSLGK